jgi:DNA polymerase-3 subunit beta
MELTIQRELLLKPLQLAASVAEKKQGRPIHANILLRIEERRVSLVGTDSEVEIVGVLPWEQSTGLGSVTVPARKLWDICKTLPENSMIKLSLSGERVLVQSGKSRFLLSTLPANEFPLVEAGPGNVEFVIDQGCLRRLLDKTAFSMAQQDVRYYLNGMLWQLKDRCLFTVATDGHRLAQATEPLALQFDTPFNFIVPRKAITELTRLISNGGGDVAVRADERHLCVSGPEFIFTSKLVEGRFPAYDRVLPSQTARKLVLDRDAFKQAIHRIAILSNEKHRGIRLRANQEEVFISANNPEHEEAEEQLVAQFTGAPIEVGYNAGYLLDVLNALPPGELRLLLSDEKSSTLIEADQPEPDCRYIIMPLRL